MAAILFVRTGACGQTGERPSAQGTLTVAATVVSSVGVEIGPDGEQRTVVANAVDPRDNVSRLRTVKEKPQDKPARKRKAAESSGPGFSGAEAP